MDSMNFKNATDLPIIISTWITKMPGLSEYVDVTVLPHTEVVVKSSVGEWILGSLFYDKEMDDQWKEAGLELESRIAKFRNTPCAWGNYTWNFIKDQFDIQYIDGVIVWSKK